MTIIRYKALSENLGEGVVALSAPTNPLGLPGGEIVLTSSKISATTLGHEIAHHQLDHIRLSEFDSFGNEVSEEIDAWVLTYSKLKRPRHLTQRLRGLAHTGLVKYKLPLNSVLGYIRVALEVEGVPKSWLVDFKRLRAEVGGYLD